MKTILSLALLALAFAFSQTAFGQTVEVNDCCWIDAKTGKQVPTIPMGGMHTEHTPGTGAAYPANDVQIGPGHDHAFNPKTGQNYVREPCPPPATIQVAPQMTTTPVEHAMTPPTFNWTGAYMGIQFGYTRSSSDYSLKLGGMWNDFPDVRNEIEFRGRHEFDENGFGLGGCAGYNYQFNNNVVIGVGIAGRKFWGLCDTFNTGDFPADNAGDFDVWSSFKTTGIVTFGPKAGYACGRFLPYVSGGLAFGEIDASQKIFSNSFGGLHEIGKQGDTRVGWNVAGGLQYAVTNNWSLRFEYSYSDLGTFKYPGKTFPDTFHGFSTWHMATLTEHGANAGIVYTFH